MVSFFGLKFGDKKKKSENKGAGSRQMPQGWERADLDLTKADIPIPRPDTAQSQDFRSPYGPNKFGRGNFAASSMVQLGREHGRKESFSSLNAGNPNARARFGANNGSSLSLAAPSPAFGSKFRAGNGSSSSLAVPGPGFSSRPGAKTVSSVNLVLSGPAPRPATSAGRATGGLDPPFPRSPAFGPSTPKSPLGDMKLPMTPTSDADNSSVFGEEADEMVETIMASVQEKLAKEKKTAGYDRERTPAWQDVDKALEAGLAPRPRQLQKPASPRRVFRGDIDVRPGSRGGLQGAPSPVMLPDGEATFRGNLDDLNRPGSRGGIALGPPQHGILGPPQHGPPTHELPQPPNQGGARRGPQINTSRGLPPQGPLRANSSDALASTPRSGNLEPRRFNSDGDTSRLNGLGAPRPQVSAQPSPRAITPVHEFRSESPVAVSPLSGPGYLRSRSPVRKSAIPRALSRSRSPLPDSLNSLGIRQQDSSSNLPSPAATEPTLRELMAQSPEPMNSDSDDDILEQFARPIIRSVQARRDTLTLNTPRRVSLSMEIDELEKSLAQAQQIKTFDEAEVVDTRTSSRASMTSSFYSDEEDVEEPTSPPTVTLQPAPLRSSSLHNDLESSSRELDPARGSFLLRRGPRRPTLDEYGTTPSHLTADSRPYGGSISPSPRNNAFQFQQQANRTLSPSPTLDPPSVPSRQRPTVSTVIDSGFRFDFGPNIPPTPDSATWPLTPTPPAEEPAMSRSLPEVDTVQLKAQAPPPLSFNFSPDAYSRDPALWTPPLLQQKASTSSMNGRTSTSHGLGKGSESNTPSSTLQPPGAGPPNRSRTPVDGHGADEALAAATALGVGIARGPSVRADPRFIKQRVDAFGTDFI